MKHDAIDLLRRLPLFADLPEADLEALRQKALPTTLPAGAWLMREGEQADALYVVLEGAIEISRHSGGQTVPVAICGPGEIIGEMALLEQAPRSASGRAVSGVGMTRSSASRLPSDRDGSRASGARGWNVAALGTRSWRSSSTA